MGMRFHRHPRTGRSEIARRYEFPLPGSSISDPATVQVEARLVADDPEARPIPLDANAWGRPTIGPDDRDGMVSVSWSTRAGTVGPDTFHLLEWSGYVADGAHTAGLYLFEYTDAAGAVVSVPSSIVSGFDLPDGVDWRVTRTTQSVTWLDGERVPFWGIVQAFEPVQEANARIHDARAGTLPRDADAVPYFGERAHRI
ncbi:hypothetical protein [uncultured Microbacterium sp.]|uniref:hypothetical protein n=1 Tax=uncultured Microbacterium sp. TaxID=191216 RepID=UPI0028D16543|nr:hypothetical protein [uncultured Microbacterium sp.]